MRKDRSFRSVPKARFLVGGSLALLTCTSGNDPTGPQTGPVAAILIVSGQDQVDTVGKELGQELEVRVVDSANKPVPGRTLTFKVTAGGGSVSAASGITSDSGFVREKWTLGTSTADTQRVEAATLPATAADKAVTAVFRATAKAGAPDTVSKTAGDTQTVPAGTAVTVSPTVRLADRYGNPVPASDVVWTIAGGGGNLSTGSPARSPTSEAGVGVLTGSWSLGNTPGVNTLTASAGAVGAVSFSATGIVGPPVRLTFVIPPPTRATNGQSLSQYTQVQLEDAVGNPVRVGGVVVQASPVAGTGIGSLTVFNDTTRTAANGIATFSGLVLNGTAGDGYRISFATSASQPLSSDPITLLVGAPYQIVLRIPAAGADRGGSPFVSQPMLQVTDAGGNLTPVSDCITATTFGGTGAALTGGVTVSASGSTFAYSSLGISASSPGTYTILFNNGCCMGSGTLRSASQTIDVP